MVEFGTANTFRFGFVFVFRRMASFVSRGPKRVISTSTTKSDADILREQYRCVAFARGRSPPPTSNLWCRRFIRTEEDDRADNPREAWEKRLARRYDEKLYREYCIADFTRYREGQVGMRWRVEKEVVIGKGAYTCSPTSCPFLLSIPPLPIKNVKVSSRVATSTVMRRKG